MSGLWLQSMFWQNHKAQSNRINWRRRLFRLSFCPNMCCLLHRLPHHQSCHQHTFLSRLANLPLVRRIKQSRRSLSHLSLAMPHLPLFARRRHPIMPVSHSLRLFLLSFPVRRLQNPCPRVLPLCQAWAVRLNLNMRRFLQLLPNQRHSLCLNLLILSDSRGQCYQLVHNHLILIEHRRRPPDLVGPADLRAPLVLVGQSHRRPLLVRAQLQSYQPIVFRHNLGRHKMRANCPISALRIGRPLQGLGLRHRARLLY